MHHVVKYEIKQTDELYEYCDAITKAANNLRNAALFRVRQVLTMVDKPLEKITENELKIYNELQTYLPVMGAKYKMPTKGKTFLGYGFLNKLLYVSGNPDYFCEAMPKQGAEQTLRRVVKEMKGFYAGCRAYNKCPEKFTGKPKLPGYGKKGGNFTAYLTNQDCVVYACENDPLCHELKLPLYKKRFLMGDTPIPGRLKQVEISPRHGIFALILVFDDGIKEVKKVDKPTRICAIDMGVENIAAITNNIGEPCLLFKGGVIKSINQQYNKRMAAIQSEQTKGSAEKFEMTPEADKLCLDRQHKMDDFMSKVAKRIIEWCVVYEIDTIVIGHNTFWKQNSNLGKVGNQNFVQIPFYKFVKQIEYRAENLGIRIIMQEESYTSKASFLDKDDIPVYGKTEGEPSFSGTRYQRGMYRSKDGTVLNADLNGSANILRKAVPDAFGEQAPLFNEVCVFPHPYFEEMLSNSAIQCAKQAFASQKEKRPSRAKMRRLTRKQLK